MLRPTLSRFHLATVVALLLGVLAAFWHRPPLILAVVAAYLALTALGVTCPRLRWFGPFVCRGNRSRDRVAITFDDGPDPNSTPQLLELLHHRRIPAAFFCIGRRVEKNPSLVGQMFREGHLLENHSYSHSYATNFFSVARLESELRQTQTAVQQATGVAPKFFRPPLGHSNPRVFRAARSLGLTVVGWTVRGFDTLDSNPDRIVRRIARRLRPGAVILLHDGNIPPDRLLVTVKTLLDTIHSLGYEVVRLDQILT
jgi:peptidoglycan/xylan/chitin deacetylase (PgdA/CDA1 family)